MIATYITQEFYPSRDGLSLSLVYFRFSDVVFIYKTESAYLLDKIEYLFLN